MSEEYQLHLQIKRLETGEYLVTSDDFPGLVAQGRTVAETYRSSLKELHGAIP